MQAQTRNNPFVLSHDRVFTDIPYGMTPNQIIVQEAIDMCLPTVLMVDDKPWLRARWDDPIPATVVVVCFVRLPAGGGNSDVGRILAMVALVALSIAAPFAVGLTAGTWGAAALSTGVLMGGSMLINHFFGNKVSNASSATDTTLDIDIYSLTGNSNAIRVGNVVPEHFGRCIVYPDMVQGAYVEIDGATQDHYLYFLGVIGRGHYQIESVNIHKTPISEYTGSSYEIIQPGGTSTLVPNLVWTAAEMSGQELDENPIYAIVNPAGTTIYQLGYDVIFPGGCGSYTEQGLPWYYPVYVALGCRLVDNNGDPASDWVVAHNFPYGLVPYFYPLRYSWKFPAPLGPGRYEVYIHRTVPATDGRTIDRCTVGNVRGYGDYHPNYGDVTMLACKIKATNVLTGEVASKINVVATRMLRPVGATAMGGALAASRSIVDAVAHIATTSNGGRQPDSSLDFPSLYALKTLLDGAGFTFDWRFTSRTTVMEAIEKAAKCGGAMPYTPGGLLTLVRDQWQTTPVAVFTDADYSKDTFKLTPSFRSADDSTCVEVTYTNPVTWETETVTCLELGGNEDNPAEITLEGCTSRYQAWVYGMHNYRVDSLARATVEFQTGFKGRIPAKGDHILCAIPWVDWGQTGRIAAVDAGGIWTTEPLDFRNDVAGWMYVTLADGSMGGPFGVLPTEDAHRALGALPSGGYVTMEQDPARATTYIFGPASETLRRVRVVDSVYAGGDQVKILGNLVTSEVYADYGTMPPLGSSTTVGPALATVSLQYRGVDEATGQYSLYATWAGSATSYRVAVNGAIALDGVTQYGHSFLSSSLTNTVTITPYVAGVLQTALAKTASHTILPAPTGLAVTSVNASGLTLSWSAVTGASGYAVTLWDNGEERTVSRRMVTATTVTYSASELAAIADTGTLGASFQAQVTALVSGQASAAAQVTVAVAALPAPANLALASLLSNGVILSWAGVPGATGYKVYRGSTSGFDPEEDGELVYTGSGTSATITGLDVTAPYAHYFRVAATNLFFQDVADLAFGGQLGVTG